MTSPGSRALARAREATSDAVASVPHLVADASPLRLVGGALVVGGAAAAAGLPGLLVGTLVALALATPVSAPLAVAGGHVVLLAVGPGSLAGPSVVLVEAGFALAVASSFADRRTRALAVGAFAALTGVGWWVATTAGVVAAAGVLALLAAVATYGAYRYGLLRLGLLDPDAASESTPGPEGEVVES